MKKNLSRTLILTAVALSFGAASAFAADAITANIPFAFRTSDGPHAAGIYHVISKSAGDAVLQLRSDATGATVNLRIGTPEGGGRGEVKPRLVFHCQDDGGCVLAQVWNGSGQGWSYPSSQVAPQAKGPQYESAVVVYFNGEAAK